MSYTVKIREEALKEWNGLDSSVREQFKNKLKMLRENPHIPSAKLSGMPDCYKIQLRASGFRLVYQVLANVLIIAVVAVGKRERSQAYKLASERLR
ncbi:type II toxin-antitoxin system RelE family toxin [Erwinia sp. PsM31]|uniref:type II toxin-antitoxin system RelE family toxin n=1 Tax=Erwinia sp. PsM31 TaxID=3030535 RepID=UPI00263B74F9|nr:type II toxin-antitoxin system RelE/ParE family toxin [Erwinia sp. PsM31]MDN4626839.1 type II toxin-antitoxin system RelE/ParE family toxin [Erwinia sp. PsM31]